MAEIDHEAFGRAVADRLAALKLSFGAAVERWPELDKAMLSRAVNGRPLSAANYLLLCKLLWLRPYAFLKRRKQRRARLREIVERMEKQAVTAPVSRVTEAIEREAGR